MESQKCKYPIIRERLRSLRMEKGLTQKEVADALFWSVSTIKQYESGNRKPDEEKSDNLKTLARFYDVFPEYILGEVPYRNEQERSSFYLKEIMDDPDMSQWIDEKIKFWKYAMTVGLNQSDYSENEKYGIELLVKALLLQIKENKSIIPIIPSEETGLSITVKEGEE